MNNAIDLAFLTAKGLALRETLKYNDSIGETVPS